MPLPRLLLPLCGLLLALAVTAATATAPLYGEGEVRISVWKDGTATTRYPQASLCNDVGGSLVPMVTDAVHTLVVDALDIAGIQTTFCHMGASTMLSPDCTTNSASLKCIWYWDEGRYAGAENAVSFYRGNRDPISLTGAEMIGTAVSNHWGSSPSMNRCPCEKMQRYGAIVRLSGTTFWSDTGVTTFSYDTVGSSDYRMICAIEQSTTTTTTTTTTPLPTTTTAEPSEESNGVNVPLVIGLSVGGAVALIVIITLVVSLVCCSGCCGCSEAHAMSAWSRRESTSRANSMYSRHGDMGDFTTRSFRDGAHSKNGSIRYASVRGFNEEMEMATMVNALYARSMSMANMVAAAQLVAMPPQVMYNAWEEPQPVNVYATEPPLDRHPSQGNLAE